MKLRLAAVLPSLLAAAALTACGSSSGSDATATGAATGGAVPRHAQDVSYAGAVNDHPQRAPDFELRDSLGKRVSLSDYRGKAVLLTFIYDHCPDVCPLIVSNLHNALAQLGPRADRAQVIAVSVDPKGDTPKTVKAFLAAHEMTGRMEYLIGSKHELAPVWRGYHIAVEGTPEEREGEASSQPVNHSALVYGISGSGKLTTLYPATFKPRQIVHDVPLLAGH